MATTSTARLGLLKPDAAELVNPVAQIGDNMQKIDDGVALVGHAHTGTAGDGTPIQASGLADSAVTDPKIGNRTVDPALANPASNGTLTQLLSWIVGRILAIVGGVTWWDAPATTLAAAKAHADSKGGHVPNGRYTASTTSATQEPVWADLSGKPQTYTPTTHAATHRTGGADALTAADVGAETTAGAQTKADTATEESLVIESALPVTGSEPIQVQTTMGPAIEFPDAATQSMTFNRRWPFTGNLRMEIAAGMDTSVAGNVRLQVGWRVNGGALTNVAMTVTALASTTALVSSIDLGQIIAQASVPAGSVVTFTVSRLGADAADTHTGKLRIYHTRLRKG